MGLGGAGWAGLFTAGVTLASSLLAQQNQDRQGQQQIEQNQLDRDQALMLAEMNNAAGLAAANVSAGASKYAAEANKDITLANIVGEQGKQGGNLLINDLQSLRSRPERTQRAIDTLVGALKRG